MALPLYFTIPFWLSISSSDYFSTFDFRQVKNIFMMSDSIQPSMQESILTGI